VRLAGASKHKLPRRFGVDLFGTGGDSLAEGRPAPRWLEREEQGGRVLTLPERSDVTFPIDELAIVALYAR
jgi:hypothetical protein